MTGEARAWVSSLLRTWFDELSSSDWYNSSPKLDQMLRDRFGDELDRQGGNPPDDLLDDPETALAGILLFDQIPRNIHRGTAKAFAWDEQARALTNGMIERGWLDDLDSSRCQFALMPLMHSEHLSDQDFSIEMFSQYAPGALDFAKSHREMIARFGRFPHRNEVLGRETTEEEAAAIAEGFSW
ncbi:DUF924 family protein [Qipengyuania psychrotolerans]|uniref:DUF924 domain-containing protein n=1 Tax=Qipengyuania psychrotolerans TaxID=2867238 RepID=A0ABX8ZCY9_9SPHN|nr:DUF924 family protein [Qipengyuania psychrotolerans]QZD86847.1 DUF924 domain-containing protein [Qipengyuania psychrotolerans]